MFIQLEFKDRVVYLRSEKIEYCHIGEDHEKPGGREYRLDVIWQKGACQSLIELTQEEYLYCKRVLNEKLVGPVPQYISSLPPLGSIKGT